MTSCFQYQQINVTSLSKKSIYSRTILTKPFKNPPHQENLLNEPKPEPDMSVIFCFLNPPKDQTTTIHIPENH